MKNATTGLKKNEEAVLAFEVADEVLEIAAGSTKEKANYARHSGRRYMTKPLWLDFLNSPDSGHDQPERFTAHLSGTSRTD
jgi:hypothetical protein